MSRVDLVIPTYNGREHLHSCLKALEQQTYQDINVIVVDDGSTDGTIEMLNGAFPDIACIELTGNYGFAAACNAGIGSGSARFVALLNNDAIPEPDWLERLVDAMERHPDAGALASKILLADGSGRIHSAGDTVSQFGLPNSRGVWELDTGQYSAEEVVFSACAAAALYRRSVLEMASRTMGTVFDSDFFMYCEDVDLSWRLRLLGYQIIYIPEAIVTHQLSATGGGPLASYYVARNTFAVLAKNLHDELQLRVWPRFIQYQFRQCVEALRHAREPAARARLRGIINGPWFAVRQRHKRRLIQSSMRVGADEIERYLSR